MAFGAFGDMYSTPQHFNIHFSCACLFTMRSLSLVCLHTAVLKLIGSKLQWKVMGIHNHNSQKTAIVVPSTRNPPEPNSLLQDRYQNFYAGNCTAESVYTCMSMICLKKEKYNNEVHVYSKVKHTLFQSLSRTGHRDEQTISASLCTFYK